MAQTNPETIIHKASLINPETQEIVKNNRLDIIAFDLDGTSLPSALETPSKPGTTVEDYFKSNPELVDEFQKALDAVMDQNPGNVQFIIATGRGLDFAKRVWTHLTEGKEKYKISGIALETGALIGVDGWDNIIESPLLDKKGLENIKNHEIREKINTKVANIGGFNEPKDVSLCYHPPKNPDGTQSSIEDFHSEVKGVIDQMNISGLDVEITSSNSIEIFPQGASKSKAMEYIFDQLSQKEKYSSVSTYFCCDSLNDGPVLNKINIIASPENSHQMVKKYNIKKFGYLSPLNDLEGTIDNLKHIAADLQEYNKNAAIKNQKFLENFK